MADVLTHMDTLDVEVAPQEELDVTVGSPMEHSRVLSITKNGKHVVSEYDLADVDVPTRPDDWIAEFTDGTYTYFGNRMLGNTSNVEKWYLNQQFGYGNTGNATDLPQVKRLIIKTPPKCHASGLYVDGIGWTKYEGKFSLTGLGGYGGGGYLGVCEYLDIRGIPWERINTAIRFLYAVGLELGKDTFIRCNMAGCDFRYVSSIENSFWATNLDWIDATGTKMAETLNFKDMYYISRIRTLVGDHTLEEVERDKLCVFEGCACDVNWRGGANGPYNRLLNIQSIVAVFNGLADLTGKDSHTVIVGGECKLLTDEQIAIATQKNWNVVTLK